jgi:hypothetical protein
LKLDNASDNGPKLNGADHVLSNPELYHSLVLVRKRIRPFAINEFYRLWEPSIPTMKGIVPRNPISGSHSIHPRRVSKSGFVVQQVSETFGT